MPDFKNFIPALKSPSHNTVKGVHYGISLQWGPNTLMYNTKKVKPKPHDAGASLYSSKYKGKITVPDNPIQIADAALYLSKTKPSLGIKDPYELTDTQFKAAVDLLKKQRPLVKKYWASRGRRDRPVQERRRDRRSVVAVSDEHAQGREGSGQRPDPEGRRNRLGRHVDDLVQGEASELRGAVDQVGLDAEGAGTAGDLLR